VRVRLARNSEIWAGMLWYVLGVWIAWSGYALGLGVLSEPGSGFALFWIGLMMAGLASTVVIGAVMNGGPDITGIFAGTRWQKVLTVIAALLIYGFFFELIGFIPCSLALLLFLMFFIDPVDWRLALPVSFGAVFGIWWAMTKALKIQLPAGLLAGWLG
jgi:putative tricarboxylic transport membrane protein